MTEEVESFVVMRGVVHWEGRGYTVGDIIRLPPSESAGLLRTRMIEPLTAEETPQPKRISCAFDWLGPPTKE